jgi:hypothetical protein
LLVVEAAQTEHVDDVIKVIIREGKLLKQRKLANAVAGLRRRFGLAAGSAGRHGATTPESGYVEQRLAHIPRSDDGPEEERRRRRKNCAFFMG